MLPNWLSFVDVIFIAVAVWFAWGGFQKGFAAQLAHVLASVSAGLLLFFAYPYLFSYFGRVCRGLEEAYLMWLLLAALVLVSIGLFMLFSKLLAGLIKTGLTGGADMGLGIVFGLVRGIFVSLIALILLVMLDQTGGAYDKLRAKSQVGRLVCYEMVPRIQPRLTSLYESRIRVWKNKLLEQEEAASEVEM